MQRLNLLIIGDEILNGRRKDCHLENAIELFEARGLTLHRSLIIADDPELITESLRMLNNAAEVVFSFGGIGATPDDYTRQCAAKAFEVPLAVHAEGLAVLQKKFADKVYPHRVNLITIPQGSQLIPNPYNDIPGFSFNNIHFLPGFPQMAKPMLAWVLDTLYPHLQPVEKFQRRALRVYGKGEGDLVDMMNALLQQFPEIKLSCLPRIDVEKTYVELSVLGEASRVNQAYQFIVDELDRKQLEWV